MNNEIIEVEFKGRRKEQAANPQQFPFTCGDPVIVSTDRGYDLGVVSYCGIRPDVEAESAVTLAVVRKATASDVDKLSHNRHREHEAKQTAKQKIKEHNLEMKLVDVEAQWDGKKLTFYFTADGRVDFRELVKDLAASFRTRIDLRQIGARDETRKSGGFGVCGEPLCCSTHLSEFKPITTQMPRDQFLPLNPTKLSGVCGRLKCCLRYELEGYRDFQKQCPKVGHPTKDDIKGEGVIDKIDVIREAIHIRYQDGSYVQISQPEFLEISNWKQQMPKNECICTCSQRGTSLITFPPPIEEEEDERSVASTGDRVTIGDKGMSVELEGVGSSVNVQTDVNAESKPEKKKKRRSRHKRTSVKADSPKSETRPEPKVSAPAPVKQPALQPRKAQPPKSEGLAQSKQPETESGSAASSSTKKHRRRGGRRAKPSGKE
jgi:cell fate regulator YaaT (PSP1 superfamily)